MIRNTVFIGLLVGFLLVGSTSMSSTPQEQEQDRAALAKAVTGAKVSLEQGVATATREGKALSAKFEIEDGRLQLSVYRVKDGQFAEVILDAGTGAVAHVDPITSGGDYTEAQNQNAPIAKAKRSLRAAIAQVVKGNPGFVR